MSERIGTDGRLSVASSEFLWDSDQQPESHRYLLAPLIACLRSSGAQRVLDLGCGNGALAHALQRNGFEVAGLDHSESGLAIARRNYPGIVFAQHDLARPLPDEHVRAYDAVVAVEVVEHLLLPRLLLLNAARALRPGGQVVVTTPYHGYLKNLLLAICGGFDAHWHPLRDYGHIKFFSRKTLRALLGQCGFTNLRLRTAGRVPLLAKSMLISGVWQP